MICCFIGLSFSNIHASYTYLNTQTLQRLDADFNRYSWDKELYINSMVSRLNTMIQKETSAVQRAVLIELRNYYETKRKSVLNVDKIVDELFGTKVEYTPTYNTPEIPQALSSNIKQQSSSTAVVEFRWWWVNRATSYQIRFNNGVWSNNGAHTNHLRTMTCGTTVHAQVRACNSSGCSNPLYLQATASCTNYNNNNSYYDNYYNNNNNNTFPYTNFAQFKNKFYDMYQKGIITNSEYNRAVKDLETYNDYTRANQFYEGFLKTSYHAEIVRFYDQIRSRWVITQTEHNSRVTNVYNRMHVYNSQVESIYNQELQSAKNLLRANALSVADRLVNRGQITSSYRSQILARFDTSYATNQWYLDMYDQAMRDLNAYEYSNNNNNWNGNSNDCTLQLGSVTYRLDTCSKSFSLRKWYGDQEFGFTISSTDSSRNYYVEVHSDVSGLPYNAITWGFSSGYVQGSRYISRYFSDANIQRGNYSGSIRIVIRDSYGNSWELRQHFQLNSY